MTYLNMAQPRLGQSALRIPTAHLRRYVSVLMGPVWHKTGPILTRYAISKTFVYKLVPELYPYLESRQNAT